MKSEIPKTPVSGNPTYRPEHALIDLLEESRHGSRAHRYNDLVIVERACLLVRREAPPKRPANIPGAAILTPGGKVGGWWHYCEFDKNDDHTHCTIWNKVGLVLYEGVFLPLDRKPLGADELKVEYNERWGDNAQFICLGNGRILVPASDFDRLSQVADSLNGKRPSP
jgi:hypothetical protein